MNKPLGLVTAAIFAGAAATHAAPFNYTETGGWQQPGDLPDFQPITSVFPFDVGRNTVSGQFHASFQLSMFRPYELDFDNFAFSIPAGSRLVAASFAFTTGASGNVTEASTEFDLCAGNTSESPCASRLATSGKFSVLSGSSLPEFSAALPLGEGVYSVRHDLRINLSPMWTAPGSFWTSYTWTFEVAPVTESPTLALNPDGVGHILIVPYFSTQSGNATLLNIVNTDTVNGKAVKIRFRGASNSDDVFDFQLFLSPADVWAANVSKGASGLSRLTTEDKSCTLPANVNQDFITIRLNTIDLSGDALANETREGYVEILTMGDIPPSAETTSLGHAIQHNEQGVPPCTAPILVSLTQGDTRLLNPTTGLMANWTIINVANTTIWSGEALALEARSQGLAAEGRNLYWPQTATSLTAEQIAANTADPLLLAGTVEAASHDLPDLSTPYTLGAATPVVQATELSDALAAKQVAAEYLTNPTIGASTDWIVSQPTRRYYAAVDYAALMPQDRLVTNYDDHLISGADYYRSRLSDGVGFGNTVMGNSANGCRPWQAAALLDTDKFWNHEGVSPTLVSPIATPPPLPPMVLCGAVAVIGINSPMSPVSASVTHVDWVRPRPDAPLYGYSAVPDIALIDGWGTFTALNRLTPNPLDDLNLGLPMLVTQFSKATNSSVAPGVSGTFGSAWNAHIIQAGKFFAP